MVTKRESIPQSREESLRCLLQWFSLQPPSIFSFRRSEEIATRYQLSSLSSWIPIWSTPWRWANSGRPCSTSDTPSPNTTNHWLIAPWKRSLSTQSQGCFKVRLICRKTRSRVASSFQKWKKVRQGCRSLELTNFVFSTSPKTSATTSPIRSIENMSRVLAPTRRLMWHRILCRRKRWE